MYANTLPIPKSGFFQANTWAHLANWETELKTCYEVALRMLGVAPNPRLEVGDTALQKLACQIGKFEHFQPTNVAVYFGEPGVTVPDPYFGGKGPDRTGCIFCGGCMLGCRHNSKNTLDKNYLYLAQQHGAVIRAESEVVDVIPLDRNNGAQGYQVKWQSSTSFFKKRGELTTKGVIFAGGVLGTIKLLLKLKQTSLPNLSNKLGTGIRTNSESLVGVTTFDKNTTFSNGVAIGSILHTDEDSHLEPVRYSDGSGFWRLFMAPMSLGGSFFQRIGKMLGDIIAHPVENLRIYFVDSWARRTQILLFMQTINSTLRLARGPFGVMKTSLDTGDSPSAFIPQAMSLAKQYAKIVNGRPVALFTETMFGIPTTAHILGGAVMGQDPTEGVINKDNRVFGYENMFICDGSMISANPGVNPSLTITALTERTMSKIPPKNEVSFGKNV